MKKLASTTNPVLLSYIEALLHEAKIEYIVADRHMSNTEGSIALFPRRILVPEDSLARAVLILRNADLEGELDDGLDDELN